ncbi:protein msta [Eurytemora carolleeae]|uniref:protein msta n=1 Tax=Eurytemora carolleeae TaxID=1294199 RepID=UPI000C785C68|nr:protein msta [Eurytemora carolleeae]|eukprot:XP_023343379.1 protein msta-like [Eurytemora affinis]
MLEKKWLFECNCARCTDPTEGGTYLSALLCRTGKCGGAVLPLDPTDGSSEWRCRKCNTEIDTSLVIKIVTSISSQIDNPSPGVQPIYFYEKLISLYSNILHPSHYLNYQMKERLSILYGNIPGFLLKSMTRPQLDRKIQVCLEVLDVQNKLYPGHSSIKIKILGELNKTRLCTVKRDVDHGILLRVCYENILRSEEDLKKYLQLYKTKFFNK